MNRSRYGYMYNIYICIYIDIFLYLFTYILSMYNIHWRGAHHASDPTSRGRSAKEALPLAAALRCGAGAMDRGV